MPGWDPSTRPTEAVDTGSPTRHDPLPPVAVDEKPQGPVIRDHRGGNAGRID
jgi:hypothetical protein